MHSRSGTSTRVWSHVVDAKDVGENLDGSQIGKLLTSITGSEWEGDLCSSVTMRAE